MDWVIRFARVGGYWEETWDGIDGLKIKKIWKRKIGVCREVIWDSNGWRLMWDLLFLKVIKNWLYEYEKLTMNERRKNRKKKKVKSFHFIIAL